LQFKDNRPDLITFKTVSSIARSILTLLEGLKREKRTRELISLTDSLDAEVRHNLSERSLMLRPTVKRKKRQNRPSREGVPVRSKETGERVQNGIDDVHHGQEQKGLSKTCQYTIYHNKTKKLPVDDEK
jgi:hypothetical protein